MNQLQTLQLARESIKDNRKLLDALGSEKTVRSVHHPEEDIIEKLLALLPKSDLGKAALLVTALGIVAYELLKARD
jgi:hypothetical protein